MAVFFDLLPLPLVDLAWPLEEARLPLAPGLLVLGLVWLRASAKGEVAAFLPASCLPRSS